MFYFEIATTTANNLRLQCHNNIKISGKNIYINKFISATKTYTTQILKLNFYNNNSTIHPQTLDRKLININVDTSLPASGSANYQ